MDKLIKKTKESYYIKEGSEIAQILNKIPRMPASIVENLVKSFKTFQHILVADIPSLDDVEGIGEVRAKNIIQSLKRMQEQYVFDNVIL